MPYAITMIKGNPLNRNITSDYLNKKEGDLNFKNSTGVEVEKVLMSFGWADFVLILKGNNIELIKETIIKIRAELQKQGDSIETSSIMCTSAKEIDEMKGNFFGNQKENKSP